MKGQESHTFWQVGLEDTMFIPHAASQSHGFSL